ncbi:MAG: cold shock domain-containing protein, partial [Bacteroidota bacterium]
DETKTFGVINEEGADKEHFVHVSGLIDEIREGDQVEFDLEQGKKGLNAVNVRVI